MNKFFLFFFLLLSFISKGQVYQSMPQWGYGPVKRFDIDSSLTIPTFSGLPSLRTTLTKKSAIAFDSTNNRFYFYNPKTSTWGTAGGTDTISLSNRIDLRVKYSDTASMLSPYLRSINQIDTNSLSNRINLKLSISDSSSMLNPYLRKIDTSNKWVSSVTKVNDSTIRVIKDGTTNDLVITTSSVVTSATRLITSVYNKSGATITKGSVVYIDGAHSSTLPSIALAKANAEETSAYTYGLVETDIPNNSQGTVIQNGTITNLNLPTSSYTDGQTLYLSQTIAGGYTTTKPLAPYHYVAIGTITRAHPNLGTIQIAIRNGFQLDELSDVQIALVPNDSTILQFSRIDSLWHDVSPTTAIGSRYIKPSDTATMLTNYIRSVNYGLSKSSQTVSADTSKLSTLYQTNLKVKYTDTATMLTNYITTTNYGLSKSTKTISADTTKLSTLYQTNLKLNATDTASLSSRIDLIQQDISLIAMQAMGSTIKGYNLTCPIISLISTNAALTSGNILLTATYIPKSTTITGVKFFQSTQGVYTANNYNGVGLYSVSGGTLTLVASSTNDGNVWKGTSNTWQTKAFSSTYSAAAGIYYVAALYSSSAQTTAPAVGVMAASINTTALKAFDFGNSLKLTEFITGQTSMASSITSSATTYASGNYGIYIY